MYKNLPAPSWSPTGESGYWVWREQGEYNKRTETWEPKWKWMTDEEYEALKRERVNERINI